MSVIVKQIVEGMIEIQSLKTVLEMAGYTVQSPGLVTLHDSARGTHQVPVDLHIPALVLVMLGLQAGLREEYGLGLTEREAGKVEVLYDRYYASRDLEKFTRKLGNLSKVGKLKGAGKKINVLYNRSEDLVQVQVAAGSHGGNAFMPGGKGKVR